MEVYSRSGHITGLDRMNRKGRSAKVEREEGRNGEEEWDTEEDVEECADEDTKGEGDIKQEDGTQKSVQKRTQKVMYGCAHWCIQLLQYVALPMHDHRQA